MKVNAVAKSPLQDAPMLEKAVDILVPCSGSRLHALIFIVQTIWGLAVPVRAAADAVCQELLAWTQLITNPITGNI